MLPITIGERVSRPDTKLTMAMTKEEVEAYLQGTDVRTPLESALNSIVASKSPNPAMFFADYFVKEAEYKKMG